MSTDLNRLLIPTDGPSGEPLGDHSVVSEDGSVAVYFRDLERRIISYIEAADVVSAAWRG